MNLFKHHIHSYHCRLCWHANPVLLPQTDLWWSERGLRAFTAHIEALLWCRSTVLHGSVAWETGQVLTEAAITLRLGACEVAVWSCKGSDVCDLWRTKLSRLHYIQGNYDEKESGYRNCTRYRSTVR